MQPASSAGWRESSPSAVVVLVAATVIVRAVPALIWRDLSFIRDEASYASLAERLLSGEGITPTAHGWLWAPLYPALLALHKLAFGSFAAIRGTQVLLSGLCVVLVYRLGRRLGGESAGLVAGWLYALEPTLIAFSHYLWTEHLYTLWLLLSLVGALRARDRAPAASILPGLALGLAILTRGVGTFALPFLLPALLWRRPLDRRAWARAGFLALATALVVLPYSVYASRKFGGLVISDTSIGFNMWLGNNDFEPVTFDYQMGGDTLDESGYASLGGRKECWSGLPPPEKNRCEIHNGLEFIRQNPLLFLRRVWTREAQTFNPSSFLLRNLRWGRYEGIPAGAASALCWLVIAAHFIVVGSAALGAGGVGPSRPGREGEARSALCAATWCLTLYHLAAAGALIGISRFRIPLLPMWMPFSALLLARPRATLREAFRGTGKALFTTALFVLLMLLSLVYLGRAFPAAHP